MRIAWDDQSSVGKAEISGQGEFRQRRESLRGDTGVKMNESEPGRGASAPPSICSLDRLGVSCSSCLATSIFREAGLRSHYFRGDGVKSLRTLPIFRKRSFPDSKNDTRPSKRKKMHMRQTAKAAELVKKSRRIIRADEEDIVRRRESLRSYTALKNNDGKGCRVSDCAQGDKEARDEDGKKLQMTVSESHEQMFYERDVLNHPGEAAKLITGLLELNENLQDQEAIFRKCKELSDIISTTETYQGELQGENEGAIVVEMVRPDGEIVDVVAQNEGRNRASVVGFVGNHKCDHEVMESFSEPHDGDELIHSRSSHLGQSSALNMRSSTAVISSERDDSIHPHKEQLWGHEIIILSSDGEGAEGTVVISSDDEEEGANRKKILDMNHGMSQSHSEEHQDRNQPAVQILDMDNGMSQSHSEEHPDGNQPALPKLDNAASSCAEVLPTEPIVLQPLACMQKFGPWSTRIRKDGRRWRKQTQGWTHIKRKYLRHRRFGEARFSEEGLNLQSLLRKEETRCSDEIPDDDEDLPYEVYRRSSQMAKGLEPDPDAEELEDLFQEMALALDKRWEKRETLEGNQAVLQNDGGCSHDYAFEDEVGWVCEKCGLVGQDIQSIFIRDSTRPKKRAAIVPVQEDLGNPESQDYEGLCFAQGRLSRVTLTLHPYYEEKLHTHQKEGITFLTRNLLGDAKMQLPPGGCILAHAPGTGKSCLTVSFVQSFLTAYSNGRPLIVAPKIMLRPWQNEFERWNVEDVPVYNLNETLRKKGRKSFREKGELATVITSTPYYKERLEVRRFRLIKKWLKTRSVLVVSYNLFACLVLAGLNDETTGSVKQQLCEALLDGPELLILDEGHFPRTKRTKISQALMRVRTNRKILLSGTLFQNNFKELFNIMKLARHNFMSLCPEFATRLKKVNPRKEPSSDQDNHFAGRAYNELNLAVRECEEQMFMDDIGYILEEFVEGAENFDEINLALRKLRALTGPIVNWYTGQILESLPGLHEFVVYLNLTAHQHKLLSRLKCKSSFEEKTRLAEVCIHPELLKYAEDLELASTAGDNNTFNAQHAPSEGVKTDFVLKLLRLCRITGERLLVFCQTLSPLTLIESMLANELGWSMGKEVLRLDGTMQSDERQSTIELFNDGSSQARVMMASITACKEGISLVGASRVVILDVLYNPSVVRQAVSRAFRIGQKKKVYVYRLVAAHTKEERIFQAAVQKDWLSTVLMNPSLRMSGGNRYRAEKILQLDAAPEDRILQKMLHTDGGTRIDRVCRYQCDFCTKQISNSV